MPKRDPYPLQWPDGWARTPNWKRDVPKFIAKLARDRDAVIRRLERRSAANIVITSDLPVRGDGLPYANATAQDPGIAVWWVEKGAERVMACDRWRTVSYNLRAIEKSLDAMAGLDRWGASQVVERAFAGFAALPAGDQAERKEQWYEILGATDVYSLYNDDKLSREDLMTIIKMRHRAAIKEVHPDVGDGGNEATRLNAALDEAKKVLEG